MDWCIRLLSLSRLLIVCPPNTSRRSRPAGLIRSPHPDDGRPSASLGSNLGDAQPLISAVIGVVRSTVAFGETAAISSKLTLVSAFHLAGSSVISLQVAEDRALVSQRGMPY